jgi:lipid A 3-O-deacylase
VNAEGYRNYLQFRLGTEMYTPTDLKSPEPPPGQHPYAGVIYVDSSLFSMSRVAIHQLTLRLGLVGPATGAEHIQRWIHEIIGSPIPQGWDTQLKNEPIVNLFYQYNHRLLRQAPRDRFGFDFSWNGGAGLGNYYIGANVGLLGRIGYRLPDNYGVTPLLGGDESLVGIEPPRKRFLVYAFLAGQGFGIARWLPTDGNTFVDSRSGNRDDWFFSLSGGLVLGYSRLLLTYRYHGISGLEDPENFRTENRNDFGTLELTFFFG